MGARRSVRSGTFKVSFRKAKIMQFANGIGLQVYANPHRADGLDLFDHKARHPDLVKRQRHGKPGDAAASNDHPICHEV